MEQADKIDLNHYQKAVIENAKWVDAVLLSGMVLGGTIIIAKVIGAIEFDLHNLKISVENAWIIFSIMTVAHFYTSWLLNREILRLWERQSDENCMAVFNEVRATGGIFVRGLSPRTVQNKSFFGIQIYEMSLDDPSTWAAHIFAFLLIAAIIPFNFSDTSYFILMFLVAVIITFINWIIGSLWIIPLSELAISHNESKILSKKIEMSKSPARKLSKLLKILVSSAKGKIMLIYLLLTLIILLITIVIPPIVILFSTLYTLGYGGLFVKSVVALGAVLVLPRMLKKALLIRHFGRIIFIILFLTLTGLIVTGYVFWIS